MRFGTSPAGQAISGKTFGGYVQPKYSSDLFLGTVADDGANVVYPFATGGAQPVPGAVHQYGGPRAVLGDCKALEDAEAQALKAWEGTRDPFARSVLGGLWRDAARRRYQAGCGEPVGGFWVPPQPLETNTLRDGSYYAVAHDADSKGNVPAFTKAAGQSVEMGRAMGGAALTGLAVIVAAGGLGYYFGKRSKKAR